MLFSSFTSTATSELYTLSLHDALPIFNVWIPVESEEVAGRGMLAAGWAVAAGSRFRLRSGPAIRVTVAELRPADRSEEHTSELQSQSNLVCRLLLEKKNDVDKLYAPFT